MSCCRYLVTPGRLSIFKRVWILALLLISILHISHYGKRNIIIRQNEIQKSGLKNDTFVTSRGNKSLNGTKFVTRENSSNLSNPIVEPLKVLLIASNPRSGSSFVGELISSMPNVSYFFEPLWLVDKRVQIIKEPMSQLEYLQLKMRMETRWRMGEIRKKSLEKLLNESRHQSKSDSEIITERINLINQLLNCKFHDFKNIVEDVRARDFVFKKPYLKANEFEKLPFEVKNLYYQYMSDVCTTYPLRVTKLFRLRMVDIIKEMRNASSPLGSKFKVILLLRDPRATINSINQQPQEWISGTSNPSTICRNGVSDYMAVRENPDLSNRVMVLKYEELVENPLGNVKRLLEFVNARQHLSYANYYLHNHMRTQSGISAKSYINQSKTINSNNRQIKMNFFLDIVNHKKNGSLTDSEYEQAIQTFFSSSVNHIKSKGIIQKYYSTYRSKKFKHDHWRKEIDEEILHTVNSNEQCQTFMNLLRYH